MIFQITVGVYNKSEHEAYLNANDSEASQSAEDHDNLITNNATQQVTEATSTSVNSSGVNQSQFTVSILARRIHVWVD